MGIFLEVEGSEAGQKARPDTSPHATEPPVLRGFAMIWQINFGATIIWIVKQMVSPQKICTNRAMTHPLVAAEIHAANTHLADLVSLSMPHNILFGGALVCGILGIPLLTLWAWLEDHPPIQAVVFGVAFVGICLLGSKIIEFRMRAAFKRLRTCALKLEYAGYVVFKRPVFFGVALDATSTESELPDNAILIEFRKLSLHEFQAAIDL